MDGFGGNPIPLMLPALEAGTADPLILKPAACPAPAPASFSSNTPFVGAFARPAMERDDKDED